MNNSLRVLKQAILMLERDMRIRWLTSLKGGLQEGGVIREGNRVNMIIVHCINVWNCQNDAK